MKRVAFKWITTVADYSTFAEQQADMEKIKKNGGVIVRVDRYDYDDGYEYTMEYRTRCKGYEGGF